MDELFLETGIVQVTSSIYATKSDSSSVQSMYNAESANLFSRNVQENSSFEIERYEAGINSLYTTGNQGFYEVSCLILHLQSPNGNQYFHWQILLPRTTALSEWHTTERGSNFSRGTCCHFGVYFASYKECFLNFVWTTADHPRFTLGILCVLLYIGILVVSIQ